MEDKKEKLLIVDDEEDIRLNLCDFMELEGFEVCEASNGREALEAVAEHKPAAVISDLMMPEMGGMEFLEELPKRNIDTPVIIMTAFGTIDYAAKAMKVGAADFITKPIDQDYMLTVIQRVLNAARLERKVKEQQRQMEADLRLAGKIQRALLPKPIDTHYLNMTYRFEPMIDIGGDHLTTYIYDEDHIAIALFDVSGHGIAASMVASMVHHELFLRMKEERPPHNIVEHAQRYIKKSFGETGMYLTMVIVDVDLSARCLTACNAGHQELLVWQQNESKLHAVPAHVPPVGFNAPPVLEEIETRIPLAAGDRILLYTDGFPEARGEDGDQYGRQAFQELIEKNIHLRAVDLLQEVFKAIKEYSPEDPDDDLTLALVDIK